MLPKPIGLQREVLYLPPTGHFVVLGTAGSGKTTLAILRAAYLSKEFTKEGERTLLVTFNNTLRAYLESIGTEELRNVDVHTYHKFARGYLKSHGKMGPSSILSNREYLVKQALEQVKEEFHDPILKRPVEVFCKEFAWIARSGITSMDDYKKAERVGMNTRVPRKQRELFFTVYQRYLKLRTEAGYLYDWDDIAQYVLQELLADFTPRRYKHVVIDEGQDFSPVMLKSLAATIPEDGSLTLFGDVAQQIYGVRLSWRSAGLHPTKVWKFRENYRNTKQIARLALAVAKGPYYAGVPDMVEPTSPKADGPLPAVVRFAEEAAEKNFIVKQAAQMERTQSVAIMLRTVELVRDYVRKLNAEGLCVTRLDKRMGEWADKPGIYVSTFHAAKGMEFDAVIIPHCTDATFLTDDRLTVANSEDEVLREEVRLFYVGITRARNRLIITCTNEPTRLLPRQDGLYQEVDYGHYAEV
ncbi:3'-5' exonuclease [Neomoorella thermoacetica]|uniref:3'-5' exonuclease n=1 Tax=Neomoorella thermoacetica TaxID=1525 RepID=UPI0030D070A5